MKKLTKVSARRKVRLLYTGKNIRAEMARNNIGNVDLAKILDVSSRTISLKLRNERQFDLGELIKMADFFDTTIDYLAEYEEEIKEKPPDKTA